MSSWRSQTSSLRWFYCRSSAHGAKPNHIIVTDSTRVFRLTRAVAINVVVMDYVEAARLRGEGIGWICEEIPSLSYHR